MLKWVLNYRYRPEIPLKRKRDLSGLGGALSGVSGAFQP